MAAAKGKGGKDARQTVRILVSMADALGRSWARGRVYTIDADEAERMIAAGHAEVALTSEQEAARTLAAAGAKQVTVPAGAMADALAGVKVKVKTV